MTSSKKQDRQLLVDVSPEMQIYRVLQHLSYGVETALAELIDNAIQSYIEGRRLPDGGGLDERFSMRIDINENTILLRDTARGINSEDIQRALKPGFESKHSADSLSVHGIGMKSAALWFSEDWSIKTSVPGESYSLNFDFNLPKLLKSHSNTETVRIEDEDVNKHYTIITLRNVTRRNESKEYYERTVLPFLLETFVRFAKFLDLEIYYNSLLLKPNSKKLLIDIPKPHIYPVVNSKGLIIGRVPVEWRIDLDFHYKGKAVRGFILLMETGSYGQPGIRLLRNNRVIEGTSVYPKVPEEFFGTKNKYAAQRVYGELELDDFPVDFMKTKFNDNLKDLFKELNQRLSNNYHYDIIRQATGYRAKEAGKQENQELIKEILKNMVPVRADSIEAGIEPESKNTGDSHDEKPSSPSDGPNGGTTGGNSDKYEPLPENRIELSVALYDAFKSFPGDKLPQLYDSLCAISLRKHAVMCYVATWSLLESWSSALGKADGVDFLSFLSPRIGNFATDKRKKADLRQVMDDIKGKGNCNKHSEIYGNSHALDLKTHFKILEPFIIHETKKCLNSLPD